MDTSTPKILKKNRIFLEKECFDRLKTVVSIYTSPIIVSGVEIISITVAIKILWFILLSFFLFLLINAVTRSEKVLFQ